MSDGKKAFEAKPDTIAELLKLGIDQTICDDSNNDHAKKTIGPYELTRLLGRGGMGDVWLASDTASGASVAVKWLHSELSFDAQSVHRFRTEAKHMAGLSHPHIVKVLQVGEHAGRPYYVLPLYRESLAGLVARKGPLPENQVLEISRTLADALAYAHGRGITHRDLKPANVLLDDNNHAYLCDFGLVRTVYNDSIINVQKKTQEGTVAYMSPATARGEAEDTRCDIYGWGAIVYEMLTGKVPYEGPTIEVLLNAVKSGAPRPILHVNNKASKPLSRVVEWAMARKLRDRYAEMNDVISDLDRIRAGKSPFGPRGKKKTHLYVVAAVMAVLLLVFSIIWGVFQNKNAISTQDGLSNRVVTSEPITQEKEEMKTTTIAKLVAVTATTAVLTQTIGAQPVAVETATSEKLEASVTLVAPYPESNPGAETDKLSLQYAAIMIAQQVELGYRFDQSQKNVGELARRWVWPDIQNVPFEKAMSDLLRPFGIGYEIQNREVVLTPRFVTLVKPYISADGKHKTNKISLQYAVMALAKQVDLGYNFDGSQKNVGEIARRWTTPDIQNVPFVEAMNILLESFKINYEVSDDKVILIP